jgi:hypothetical protein
MADRRGRDADFTGASPDSNASPTGASPVSPERISQPDRAAGDFVPNPQRYSQTARPEQAMAAYVINPQLPEDAPGLGIQPDAAPSAATTGGAPDRRLKVRIVSNPSPGGAAAGGTSRSPAAEEGTYSTANTYYDGPSGYGLDDDDDAPRRYRRAPNYQPTPDPGQAPSIRLARSVGAESIRSTQSRRSKYDSK